MTYAFIIKIIQYVYLLMFMLSGVKILLHMNRLLVRFETHNLLFRPHVQKQGDRDRSVSTVVMGVIAHRSSVEMHGMADRCRHFYGWSS